MCIIALVKWGILGPGNIAHNFANGILDCANAQLIAVAARHGERRNAFGDTFEIPNEMRFTTHADMLLSEVDAVYIATPYPFHAKLAIECLNAGKHVLVEKPAGLTADEVAGAIEAATKNQRFLMEGLMYRPHPQMLRLRELIREGRERRSPLPVRRRTLLHRPPLCSAGTPCKTRLDGASQTGADMRVTG